MSLGPAKVEFGGTRKVLDIGDSILCRVQEVEETHQSVVTMKGMGLRKIRSGALDELDPHLLGHLIGKGGSFLRAMKMETDCRIVVTDNGRLWIDGDLENILEVRKRIENISSEARIVGVGLMGGYGDVQMIDENGLRMDGRKPGDVRPITIETGVVPVADGSCRMVWGTNEAIVAVYGPMEAHPRKIQKQDRAVIDVAYNMAPFSTTDRIRPGFNRRSREISKVTQDALESVVLLELYPRSKIRVSIEIISAEAGTRCVGLTAASVALADAGIPMTDLVVSVASGKVNDVVVCDLNKEEDNYGEADLPMGILPNTGELVFLQMDGDLSPDEFKQAWDYNVDVAMQVHKLMVEALKGGEN